MAACANGGCGCGCDGGALDIMSRKNQWDMLMALGLGGIYWYSPPKSVPNAVLFVALGYGFKKCCDKELIKPLYSVRMPWEGAQ
jgi:hypothetical protein